MFHKLLLGLGLALYPLKKCVASIYCKGKEEIEDEEKQLEDEARILQPGALLLKWPLA